MCILQHCICVTSLCSVCRFRLDIVQLPESILYPSGMSISATQFRAWHNFQWSTCVWNCTTEFHAVLYENYWSLLDLDFCIIDKILFIERFKKNICISDYFLSVYGTNWPIGTRIDSNANLCFFTIKPIANRTNGAWSNSMEWRT